jgi:peptidoglycan/LPS O-acetylase OafA/YrhL
MIGSGEKTCSEKRKKKAEARTIYPIYGSQVQINQGGGAMEENPKAIKVKSGWANGSFYLFVLVVVVAGIGFLRQELSFPAFCVVVIGGVLLVLIIGALQLKQDERLQEETFL